MAERVPVADRSVSAAAGSSHPVGPVGRVVDHLRHPLHRNAYSLVVSGVVTSVLGLVFWLLVARRYSEQDVGLGAAAVSAMVLLANASGMGLQNGLVRFVPAAGRDTRRFVVRSIALAAGAAAVLTTVFLLGLGIWAPDLEPLLGGSPVASLGFVAAVVVWILFVLQDNTLIGLRRSTFIPVENLGFSVAKILLVLVLAVNAPRWGVFASFPLAAAGAVLVISGFLLPRLLTEAAATSRHASLPPGRELRRYLAAEHVSVLLWMSTIEAIPLLVLHRLGATTNAHYALATQIVYGLMLLPGSIGVAFTAESASNPALLQQNLRRSARNVANLLIPSVALVVVFAPFGLRIFGQGYSDAATTSLRFMALSTLPYSVTLLLMNVARVQQRVRAVTVTYVVLCLSLAGLSVALLGRFGLSGIGAAWLIAQTVVAIGVLATQLHRVGIRGHLDLVARLVAAPRNAWALRTGQARLRGIPARIPELGTIRSTRVIAAHDDVTVALVRSKEHGVQVLKVAHGAGAESSVANAAAAMQAAGSLEAIRGIVPAVRAVGTVDGHTYSVEEYRSGDTGLDRLRANELSMRSLEEVMASLGELHRATARSIYVDHAWLQRWVHEPIERITAATSSPIVIAEVGEVRRRLVADLGARPLTVARIHGDVALGNLVFGLQTGELNALLDWESSAPDGLPELDVVHLLAALHIVRPGVELDTTIPLLASPERWSIRDRAIYEAGLASQPNPALSPWTIATLAWLAHVDGNLRKTPRYAARSTWLDRNVDQVVLALAALPSGPGAATGAGSAIAVGSPSLAVVAPAIEAVTERIPASSSAPLVEPAPVERPAAAPLPDPAPGPFARLFRRPVLVIAPAVALWMLALRGIDLRSMSDLGLLSVLGPTAFVALALLLVAIVANLRVPTVRTRHVLPYLATFIVLVHGTPAFLYGSLRYSWAWKHVGIVDFVLRTRTFDPEVAQLAVYHQWPGFFSAAATLTDVVGADNALTMATWAPVFFNLVTCLVLVLLLDSLTADRRIVWLAATIFFVTNWVGQDYFAPQAFTYVMYLGVIAMVLQRFPQHAGNQAGRSWRPGSTAGVIAAAIVAVATSHQLTPVMLTLALFVLAVTRRAHVWRFAVFSTVVNALWALTWARPFVSRQVEIIRDRFGAVADNAGRTLTDTELQSSGQALVSLLGRLTVVAIVGLAAIGFLRRWRGGHREWVAGLLVATPASVLIVNDYGGEVVFRVVLFAMPFLAYLAAHAIASTKRVWSPTRGLLVGLVTASLLVGFLFGYYGKDRQYYFTIDEIDAVEYLETTATDGTLLVTLNSNYPNITDRYERFTIVPVLAQPRESLERILGDPLDVLGSWLDNPDYSASYLLITRGQLLEVSDIGEFPVSSVLQLAEEFRSSSAFEKVYETSDAVVYRRSAPTSQESS